MREFTEAGEAPEVQAGARPDAMARGGVARAREASRAGRVAARRRARGLGPWPARPRVAPAVLRVVPERRSCSSVAMPSPSAWPQPVDPPVVEPRRGGLSLVGAPRAELRRPLAAGAGERLLVRRPSPARGGLRERVRRVVAGVVVVVATAAIVAGLGLLAAVVGGERGTPVREAVSVSITVESPETVFDLAQRVAPAAEGAELAAMAERIVTVNSLGSVRLWPGQVLLVPRG